MMSSYPENTTDKVVLYWVTDANPARKAQIEGFYKWLIENGHVNEKGEPIVELKVDTANRDNYKILIQGVSGIGGDVMDQYGGTGINLLSDIGMLEDVTEDAKADGYDISQTYPAMKDQITFNDAQYAFPCNVAVNMLWVNNEALEKYGQPIPPTRWTLEQFEEYGKAFVKAANAQKTGNQQRAFYLNKLDPMLVYRSMGFVEFNETLTATQYLDPRFAEMLRLRYKWTYVDRILPSAADMSSFSTQQGYGGPETQLFYRGNFALMQGARYSLITLRKFDKANNKQTKLSVSYPPYGHYPVTTIGSRCAVVYVAGKHKELAKLFLQYLASEEYNMQIVETADALPPNPKYTKTEEFLRPKGYENEWGTHELFANAALNHATNHLISPYIHRTKLDRIETAAMEAVMSDLLTPKEAGEQAQLRAMNEIRQNMELDKNVKPELLARYKQDLANQKIIDECKKQGKKIPLKLITNSFYRKYYQDMGMAE